MDEATKAKFESVDAEDKRQNKRIDEIEENIKELAKMSLSVQRLADSMERMLKEQTKQGARLEALEKQPAENWNNMTRTIINTLVGALAGAIAVGLVQMIASNV